MASKARKKAKRTVRHRARRLSGRKKAAVLDVTTLGVSPAHTIRPVRPHVTVAFFTPLPPPNLPIGPEAVPWSFWRIPLRRPLVSPRTSFWLGVGFGVFVVGTMMALAWQLFKVELVEAVVVGLTR